MSYCLGHHFGNTLFIVRLDMPAILPLEVMTRLNYVRMMLLSIDSHQADLFVTQAPVKSPQPLSHTPVKKGCKDKHLNSRYYFHLCSTIALGECSSGQYSTVQTGCLAMSPIVGKKLLICTEVMNIQIPKGTQNFPYCLGGVRVKRALRVNISRTSLIGGKTIYKAYDVEK